LLRRGGTEKAGRYDADAWAPALQRTAKARCAASGSRERRFGAELHPHRHCERSEAIQTLSADALLDCFAALAM